MLLLTSCIFFPGIYLIRDPRVAGTYRGHELELDTVSHDEYTGDFTNFINSRSKCEYTRLTLQTARNALQKDEIISYKQFDLELIIYQVPVAHLPQPVKHALYISNQGQKITYEQANIETDEKNLQKWLDPLCNLLEAYPALVALGGEVVPTLRPLATYNSLVRQVATQLLADIGQETTERIKPRAADWLCPHCLVHCGEHLIQLPGRRITYYGCQVCGQSRELLNRDQYWLVAVLDHRPTAKQIERNSTIRLNWFSYPKPFEFDEVEIVQATDEEIERFVVRPGNNSDPARLAYYKQMRCLVAPACSLSENTLRILRRTFGQVEITELENRN